MAYWHLARYCCFCKLKYRTYIKFQELIIEFGNFIISILRS